MAYQATPQQRRYNDPFVQRLYQYNTPQSGLYLSNPLNTLSIIIGNDVVTNGLEVVSANMNAAHVVSVTISPGTCIVDHVFHEITDQTTLALDVSPYDDANGRLVVVINYEFLQTPESNPLRFKLCYVSNDGNTIAPVDWDEKRDRVVLAVLNFDKSSKSVSVAKDVESINILGKTYLVRGYNEDTKPNIFQFIFDTADSDFGEY